MKSHFLLKLGALCLAGAMLAGCTTGVGVGIGGGNNGIGVGLGIGTGFRF